MISWQKSKIAIYCAAYGNHSHQSQCSFSGPSYSRPALLTGKLRCYVCLRVLPYTCTLIAFHLMLFIPLHFTMCACNLHCYYFLHVVKAAETVALSSILRIPEITPSPSPCPTHLMQGNTTCMLSTLNCCFNQLLHVRMLCIP